MIYVCQHVPGDRRGYVADMKEQLPHLVVIGDDGRGAMATFLRALTETNGEPFVFLEDDAILCKNFKRRVESVIVEHPDVLIRFFPGMSTKVTESKMAGGSTYSWNQCTYFPHNMGRHIAVWYENWGGRSLHPTGMDYLVRDYLVHFKMKYWFSLPPLVQHAPGPSLISPRRSHNRQSPLFEG